ncbi:cylicin-1-like isoform X2 [Eriocheir sinensis]|uniref:cylicin-1-like isoform X2 n=1 Tax=Eriocheir sinensis TaxID=95602 RepID=UPI0021C73DC0|nr:cylicin-1-like isoform X2 [Eriocheir sinensis]
MTEDSQATLQREMDAEEMRQVNKMLRKDMNYFVSGLHVAVKCILTAIDAVKDRYSEDDKQTSASEEERDTQPCLKVEEGDKPEAEQEEPLEQTQEEKDGNDISSELMKSLNNTLDDLKQAEDKVFEMGCQEHEETEAGQPSGDSFCYLEFMSEFIAHFRQNVLESCRQFLSMEAQKVALLHARKELKDLRFDLSSSPSKAATPKVSSTVTAASRTTAQRINVEARAPSSTETTLKIDGSEDNIPSHTAAAQDDGEMDTSEDTIPSHTAVAQDDGKIDASKDSIPSHTVAAQDDGKIDASKDSIPSHTVAAQDDGKIDASTDSIPSHTVAAQDDGKIVASEDSIPSHTAAAQDNGDSEDKTSSETRSAATEGSITEDTPSVDTKATPQKGDANTTTPSEPKESTQQGDDKGASPNMKVTPQKDDSAASATEVTPEQKYPEAQVVLDDEVFDFVSPLGMTRMFGTQYEDSKISFLPPSPAHQTIDSPTKT